MLTKRSMNVINAVLVMFVIGTCVQFLEHVHQSHRQADVVRARQTAEEFRKQRDRLSSILNGVKQELAVISCQMIDLQQRRKDFPGVSAAGGWCKNNSKHNSREHAFDKPLAEELSRLFQGQAVASFGEGPGHYKRYIDSTHRVLTYDGFDGAPYANETSGGVVRFLDLTAPQFGLPLYDWIISMEVAEHIPSKYENVYIDNVVRHAKVGVVLSWAVPGQVGLSHVNNKPLAYVRRILLQKGFETDMEASTVLQKKATLTWLRKNLHVYRRLKNSTPSQTNS